MATHVEVQVLSHDPLPTSEPGGPAAWLRMVRRFCRRKPLGAFGALVVIGMLLCAIFVDTALVGGDRPLLAPDGYNHQHIRNVDQGSSLAHPMGTDELGRDIFSRILYGARISVVIGLSTVLIAGAVSLGFGTMSGYFAGWVDAIIQRVVDIFLAIPPLILLIFGVATFADRSGPYWRMFWIIMILAVVISAQSIRVVRSATIATASNQYVDAARTLGATSWRIIFRHLVPNVMPVVIVLATVQLGGVILAEASISFLGYGIPPPFPSWGAMLTFSGLSQFRAHPVQAVWPGLAIAIAVYAFNMFGDALRDVLDPRLRGGR